MKIKMRDLVPYKHGQWCRVGDSEPFLNPIVSMRWHGDGRLSAMLDSHNFLIEWPDTEVDFIEELTTTPAAWEAERIAAWRLPPKPKQRRCETCGQVTP